MEYRSVSLLLPASYPLNLLVIVSNRVLSWGNGLQNAQPGRLTIRETLDVQCFGGRVFGSPTFHVLLFTVLAAIMRDRPYATMSTRRRMPRRHTVLQVFSPLGSSVWRFVACPLGEDLVEIEGAAPTEFPLLLR
jgi:hypothetical protein